MGTLAFELNLSLILQPKSSAAQNAAHKLETLFKHTDADAFLSQNQKAWLAKTFESNQQFSYDSTIRRDPTTNRYASPSWIRLSSLNRVNL